MSISQFMPFVIIIFRSSLLFLLVAEAADEIYLTKSGFSCAEIDLEMINYPFKLSIKKIINQEFVE